MKKLIALLIALIPVIAFAQLKAFPTAEGFGKNTTGGRGGTIIHVTNLNNSGAGSLREALTTTGARTIVFDVGGDIILSSRIEIGNTSAQTGIYGDLTIAGETAPSPGITIKSFQLYFQAGNIIMRYLTFRSDPNNNQENCVNTRNWGTGGYTLENMIFDHLTLSHAGNENIGFYADNNNAPVINITLQNTMLGKNNGDGNMLVGQYTKNVSLLRNYFSHEQFRNPIIGYGNGTNETKEFINNIIYGGTSGMGASYGNIVDAISNIYKSTTNMPLKFGAFGYGEMGYTGTDAVIGEIFYDSNFPSGPFTNDSNEEYYPGVSVNNASSRVLTGSLITTWLTSQPDIENAVLTTVGNSLYRESLDTELIDDYYDGTGNYNVTTAPNKTLQTRPGSDDSDDDDMLDAAEIAVWGDITTTNAPLSDTSSPNYSFQSGYTNIEKTHFYLAGDLDLVGSGVGGTVISNPRASNSALMNN